ncbi:MAG: hypothetical protein IPL35_09290 [Sphingobacteriales bacterium]|nr:hypothetical protein [Sphingobacteriales bacterium]
MPTAAWLLCIPSRAYADGVIVGAEGLPTSVLDADSRFRQQAFGLCPEQDLEVNQFLSNVVCRRTK